MGNLKQLRLCAIFAGSLFAAGLAGAQTEATAPPQGNPSVPKSTPWVVASPVKGLACAEQLPTYPLGALRDGVSGVVVAEVKMEGRDTSVFIESGPEVFHKAVSDAIYRYKCAHQDPERVSSRTSLVTTWRFKQAFEFRAGPNDFIRMLCPNQVEPEVPVGLAPEIYGAEVKTQLLVQEGRIQGINFLSGPAELQAPIKAALQKYACRSSDKRVIAYQYFKLKAN